MIKLIKGWGDTRKDCVDYLREHPELKAQGYKVVEFGGIWLVATIERREVNV